jgi:hypothetical protein
VSLPNPRSSSRGGFHLAAELILLRSDLTAARTRSRLGGGGIERSASARAAPVARSITAKRGEPGGSTSTHGLEQAKQCQHHYEIARAVTSKQPADEEDVISEVVSWYDDAPAAFRSGGVRLSPSIWPDFSFLRTRSQMRPDFDEIAFICGLVSRNARE